MGYRTTLIHNWTIGRLSWQKCFRRPPHSALKTIVNGASTIVGIASWNIMGLWDYFDPKSNNRPPFQAKWFSTTSSPSPQNERQCSVNSFRPCILEYQGTMGLLWSIIEPSAAFLGKNAFDNLVTMPWQWASTGRRLFSALHLGISRGYETTLIHNRTIGCLSRQKSWREDRYHVPKWLSMECQRFLILHLG